MQMKAGRADKKISVEDGQEGSYIRTYYIIIVQLAIWKCTAIISMDWDN